MQRNLNQHNHGGVVTPSKPTKIFGLTDTPRTKLPVTFSGAEKILGDLPASEDSPSDSDVETILQAIEALSDAPGTVAPPVVDPVSEALVRSKPDPKNIPAALKAIPRWVPWRYGPPRENGKRPKQPYNARTGKLCDVTNPINCSSFEEVLKVIDTYDGIGIVLNGDGLIGIDLDNCIPDGRLLPRTLRLMDSIPSYWEISPSGKGLRCFTYGSLPVNGRRKGSIEVYANERFLTVTGRRIRDTDVTNCAAELSAFYQKHFGNGNDHSEIAHDAPLPEPVSPRMINERILELARNAANGAKFKRLYDDGDDGGDHSVADAALIGMLAFYTQVPEQIVDLFRQSALNRDKFEDREDYRDRTIEFVLQRAFKDHQAAIARGEPGKFYDPKSRRSPGFNDHGNAQRLVSRHGGVLRYCHDLKKWLIWDGRRWAVDTTKQAENLAKDTMWEFLLESRRSDSEGAAKFAAQSLNQARIESMLKSAQSELPIRADELDKQPQLLNFLNGTADLRTGEIHPHDPEQFITKLVHYDCKPDATAPRFMQFLREIGLEPMIDYLQKAFGYSLTGYTSEKAAFVCHGPGDNGKSTLLTLWRSLLPEYSTELQITTLMRRTQEDNVTQADLADLCSARFVKTSETEEGVRLSESKLKRITQGMGEIKACRKYENPIIFEETHKLWIDANHCPIVRGTDNAIWNRMHLIPFDVTIPAKQKDPKLLDKLLQEAEGILAWAVAGAMRWAKEGLQKPSEVQDAVAKWRDTSDPLKDFFEECCIFDPVKTAPVAVAWAAYRQWCASNQERQLDRNAFNARMEAQGCKRSVVKIDGKNAKVWKGVEMVTGVDGAGFF
jgi:putative DNA primase/helicase